MSEENKTETSIEETKYNAIDESVALMRAKIVQLEKAITEKDELIKTLSEKLNKANDFIEGDQKKMLLAEIRPRVEIPDELLMLKSLDELKMIKKTLDVARIPAFKSGTPVMYEKKSNPRQELDSTYDNYMKKIGAK